MAPVGHRDGLRRSLFGWLIATLLPLATLLCGIAAVEYWRYGHRNFLMTFWCHSGALALCHALALAWVRGRREIAAACIALTVGVAMALMAVTLTGFGFVSVVIALALSSILPWGAGVLIGLMSMAVLAGALWGICLESVIDARLPGHPFSLARSRMYAIWGSIVGPTMLVSQMIFTSPIGPVIATIIAGLSLALAVWRPGGASDGLPGKSERAGRRPALQDA